ncbi:MAG: hypothetical protein IPM24_05095 [Bryobacterales bacterium]|nr:hypothetical protein [Bryobacterales bacterium]
MQRRTFLQTAALAAAAPLAGAPRKKIATLSSTYHVRSHSDNFITRFIEGYWIHEKFYEPPFEVSSLWMDQIHPGDIGHKLARSYGFKVTNSIEEALTLGTGKLAVDGVILVCEHGNYPFNEKNQHLYPRYEFYTGVTDVYRKVGKSAPIFVDKHLSYDWTKAKRMFDISREMKFPLMAGSSLPVTFRRPELDYPLGVEFEDAVMVGGGWVSDGGVFHNLETLQVFVERRKGGESGIRAVEHISGPKVWEAAQAGRWNPELMRVALTRGLKLRPGRPEDVTNPVLALLEYNDGFKASIIMLPGMVGESMVALKVKGKPKPDSTLCYIPIENSNNFSMLVHGITQMIETGKPPFPVERTLLTTGALSFLMDSAHQGGKRIETPQLNIRYKAPAKSYYAHGVGS